MGAQFQRDTRLPGVRFELLRSGGRDSERLEALLVRVTRLWDAVRLPGGRSRTALHQGQTRGGRVVPVGLRRSSESPGEGRGGHIVLCDRRTLR